ncbi:hypothetical protein BDP27DRAFT_1362955 [Rhodocollybia butyracea]|uniref:Phytase-like domain-containing protein n=1 Tax=Rhodocollybia butyracea TaxID=206335 RepID=A0A9P5U7L0_9AGAR|nr:hypothetical protein BDP27DRAFT_1362955 [Rhodocollybia butyracea]
MTFTLRFSVGLITLAILNSVQVAQCSPHVQATRSTSASSSAVSVSLDGVTYVNKGIVGFGLIPSNFVDSLGDTMGGFGSAIAFKLGTWKDLGNGSYTGTLEAHPDRGFNVITTIDYRSRQHEIDFLFTPYTGSDNLDFATAQQTLQLDYIDTVVQFDRNGGNTSGLDALGVRAAENGFLVDPFTAPLADPEMPIANKSYQHLTIDAEGLVANSDGTYWVRNLDFTSVTNPATGRVDNQGLTLDAENNILYAMLQSATVQDGGTDKTTSRYTRMLAYDVANPTVTRPSLVGEWVVPLPVSTSKSTTRACSEIHFVSENIFFALSHDGNGNGDGTSTSDTTSKYKQADLFSIADATNIVGSEFDDPSNPVAPKGVLVDSITPATYISFVNYIDDVQLARFGLHNGKLISDSQCRGDENSTLVNEKWESLALAPVGDPSTPNDYFLFTVSDNDFLTEDGISLGVPYNAGVNVDNQFLVFQVTLPSVPSGSVQKAIGISS